MSRRNRGNQIDWITSGIYLALVIIGWLMIYAVGQSEGEFYPFDISTPAGKQFVWILISIGVLLFLQFVDYRFWESFAIFFYFTAIILLIGVLIFGTEIKGARSWYSIAGFTFQPAEFAKFATALGLAAYLSSFKTNLNNWRDRILSIGLILFPAILVLLQPDAGSAMVFLAFFIVLFREGMSMTWYIMIFILIALFILSLQYEATTVVLGMMIITTAIFLYYGRQQLVWIITSAITVIGAILLMLQGYVLMSLTTNTLLLLFLSFLLFQKRLQEFAFFVLPALTFFSLFSFGAQYIFHNFLQPHQQERINVWLRPEVCDPRGSLYNLLQSKMAIGSGGFQGKGYLEGTMTKLNYVPEQSTDFIFCTIGEEQGFIGIFILVILYMTLLWRIISMGERMKTSFERMYAYGIASILFVHFFTNIGMTMGLMPVIGIPLPFVSYGGSSLLIFTLMIAVLLTFDSARHRI